MTCERAFGSMARSLMTTIDILGRQCAKSASIFELHQRSMAGVRLRRPRRMFKPRLPCGFPHFTISHVVMNVRQLFRRRITGPQTLWTSEIGNAGVGGDPGSRQHDDAFGVVDPLAYLMKIHRVLSRTFLLPIKD